MIYETFKAQIQYKPHLQQKSLKFLKYKNSKKNSHPKSQKIFTVNAKKQNVLNYTASVLLIIESAEKNADVNAAIIKKNTKNW